jgi:hypothetical protein
MAIRTRTSIARLAPVLLVWLPAVSAIADDLAVPPPTTATAGDDHPVNRFFDRMGKAVAEGVDNGSQMAGPVKVLGYVMAYSKLSNSMQRAYCLANPETAKIITVAPTFGRPYLRADGATGFVQTVHPADAHHVKLEVNVAGTLPGNTCADLVRNSRLEGEIAAARPQPAAPAGGTGEAACAGHGGLDAVVNDMRGRSFWECRDGSRQRITADTR